MINTVISFKEYPTSVKRAILFLAIGWILHYVYYFGFLPGGELTRIDYLQLGVGVAICYFVASINKWARALCIFFNIGIMVLYLIPFAVHIQKGNIALYLFTALVIFLFGLSTYYLSRKETTQYFKEYNKPDEESETSDLKMND